MFKILISEISINMVFNILFIVVLGLFDLNGMVVKVRVNKVFY